MSLKEHPTRSETAAPADDFSIDGARKARQPASFRPALATLVTKAPAGDRWMHEIKFDGYRLLCFKSSGNVTLQTRNGKDWTDRFPPIARAIEKLPIDQCIVDGEAVVLDEHGKADFQALQNAIKRQAFDRLVFYAFDLPHCNGYDLTRAALRDRKELLRRVVGQTNAGQLRFSDHIVGGGAEVYNRACKLALEGIICKRVDSSYAQHRTRNWLKIKCSRRQEFVIVGYTEPGGARRGFGALLLAAHDHQGRLVYTGRVGTGFSAQMLEDIARQLEARQRRTSPLDQLPNAAQRRGVHWVRPDLVAEVEFTQWTEDGRLRHPSFKGLREDKPPESITIEQAESTIELFASAGETNRQARNMATSQQDGSAHVAGVKLSNPDRVMYPQQGLTKRDLAEYMQRVSERLLPMIVARPLSVVRCPRGRQQKCFFQKHVRETLAPPIRAIAVTEDDGGVRQYIGVDDLPGLVALVQYGVLEIHPWGARTDRLDRPDMITFDLDPGEGVSFDAVREAAAHVRDLLLSVDFESFVKTSGGKGLHVVVPITRRSTWAEAKTFAHAIALRMARDDPKRFVATMSRSKRAGKIFVDYLRNSRGATTVAAYSPRARPNAPVSAPIRWDELDALHDAAEHTVQNMPGRIGLTGTDPWEGFDALHQHITRARLEAIDRA